MSFCIQPVAEISRRARNVLIQELGVVDTLRFLSQFRAGDGDYTKDKERLFERESVGSIMADIKAQRNVGSK